MGNGRSRALNGLLGLQFVADLLLVLVAATEHPHVPLLWISLCVIGPLQGIALLVVWRISAKVAEGRKIAISVLLAVPPMLAAVVFALREF